MSRELQHAVTLFLDATAVYMVITSVAAVLAITWFVYIFRRASNDN